MGKQEVGKKLNLTCTITQVISRTFKTSWAVYEKFKTIYAWIIVVEYFQICT